MPEKHAYLLSVPAPALEEGESHCHTVAPTLIPVVPNNDAGVEFDGRMPVNEQFRCWVRFARTLAKNPRLPKARRLLCRFLVEAVSLDNDRRPARSVPPKVL